MIKNYNVIGSGFSGLSVAASLAKAGKHVKVIEKNNNYGGRSRQFSNQGFIFDMGPSWYWMPDVFERFFAKFGKSPSDYYDLKKLNPGFQIIFDDNHVVTINKEWSQVLDLFEQYEIGASDKLIKFMNDAEIKYNIGMKHLVYKPGLSIKEFFHKDILKNISKMSLFHSYRKHVCRYFKNPFLQKILEFPVLFLGTSPQETPALYSLMAYSGLKQGTYYPMGGFGQVVNGMVKLCKELGVEFHNNHEVIEFDFSQNKIQKIITKSSEFKSDFVVF